MVKQYKYLTIWINGIAEEYEDIHGIDELKGQIGLMPDRSDLRQRQALPLSAKVLMSQNRIREWYQHFNGDVCVSFSGGKDSTVLAHLVHDMYPEVPLVFCNTGLEYPEIQAFAKKMGAGYTDESVRQIYSRHFKHKR